MQLILKYLRVRQKMNFHKVLMSQLLYHFKIKRIKIKRNKLKKKNKKRDKKELKERRKRKGGRN
jgi:hypothetical protein